jgi:hypothetical protein
MDLQAWASLISVVVAIVAVFYAGNSAYASMDSAAPARDSATAAADQARAVEEQTRFQQELARAAAEAALWVDIRGDDATGQALVLLLGNSRPSLARKVKVTFDPAPPATQDITTILESLTRHLGNGTGPNVGVGVECRSQLRRLERAHRVQGAYRG